mmetsp:Transcript_30899/g.64582  ORF Transcript_30899/g.64582 Transcript_30899/m.64582 type:complete len:130 (-) Transcript_30899:383-772(-)
MGMKTTKQKCKQLRFNQLFFNFSSIPHFIDDNPRRHIILSLNLSMKSMRTSSSFWQNQQSCSYCTATSNSNNFRYNTLTSTAPSAPASNTPQPSESPPQSQSSPHPPPLLPSRCVSPLSPSPSHNPDPA